MMNIENPVVIDQLWRHNENDYQHEAYQADTAKIRAINEELEETLEWLDGLD